MDENETPKDDELNEEVAGADEVPVDPSDEGSEDVAESGDGDAAMAEEARTSAVTTALIRVGVSSSQVLGAGKWDFNNVAVTHLVAAIASSERQCTRGSACLEIGAGLALSHHESSQQVQAA